MNNIILIGMMGCGKTTVGHLLSERLGLPLVDTDALIEIQEGCPISALFARHGEDYFRRVERSVARELAGREGLVIACGGGLPLSEEAIRPLKDSGLVFWLRRDPVETYDTLDKSGRPLAQQGRETFLARFAQREPVYRQWADHIIGDFSTPDATANAILEVLK